MVVTEKRNHRKVYKILGISGEMLEILDDPA
jgi:hypothetical protein